MNIKNKVCCFGELLLRLSPDTDNNNWLSANSMPFYIGGAELNAATALAKWQVPVKYVTAVPDNYLSRQIIEFTEKKQIDCSGTLLGSEGLGIYYLPVGLELKNNSVIYDRANSSFSALEPGMIDWDMVLDDCCWFHFSAISPSLKGNLAAVCQEALEVAMAKGLTISVDLNYRNKLWQYGKSPIDVMPGLVRYCDVVMGNIWAVESLLGIGSHIQNSNGKTVAQLEQAAAESMAQIRTVYPKVGTVAYTYRLENSYLAAIGHGDCFELSMEHTTKKVVDKVGSGDCFMAGLIYGLYHKKNARETVDFAASAAVGKLYEAGDATQQDINDVVERLEQLKSKKTDRE